MPPDAGGLEGLQGLAAVLERAIVIGPLARLELRAEDDHHVIEAHLGAQQFRELRLAEGDRVLVKPRQARIFVEGLAPVGAV
jgi:sulfate transport system ATP-binding protein